MNFKDGLCMKTNNKIKKRIILVSFKNVFESLFYNYINFKLNKTQLTNQKSYAYIFTKHLDRNLSILNNLLMQHYNYET